MLTLPYRILIYTFNNLFRFRSPHPTFGLLHREALGKRKSSLVIEVSHWGTSRASFLTVSQELISLNQMKCLRRSHKAERKIDVKKNTKFCEEFEGPAFKKGHHTFRTSELEMFHMQLLICKKCLHKYLILFTVGKQLIWKRKWELGVETCLLVSFFIFSFLISEFPLVGFFPTLSPTKPPPSTPSKLLMSVATHLYLWIYRPGPDSRPGAEEAPQERAHGPPSCGLEARALCSSSSSGRAPPLRKRTAEV